jgi:hypothetical protein
MDWRIIKQAVDGNAVDLPSDKQTLLFRFTTNLEGDDAFVIDKAIENGISSLTPSEYKHYQSVKETYNTAPAETVSKPKTADSVIMEDGRVLYDNTRGDEMSLSDLYGNEPIPTPIQKRKPVAVQDTIFDSEGNVLAVDKEFEPVKRAPRDSSFLEQSYNKINDYFNR